MYICFRGREAIWRDNIYRTRTYRYRELRGCLAIRKSAHSRTRSSVGRARRLGKSTLDPSYPAPHCRAAQHTRLLQRSNQVRGHERLSVLEHTARAAQVRHVGEWIRIENYEIGELTGRDCSEVALHPK